MDKVKGHLHSSSYTFCKFAYNVFFVNNWLYAVLNIANLNIMIKSSLLLSGFWHKLQI